jgi:uncharacterized protein (TIGR03067 family)
MKRIALLAVGVGLVVGFGVGVGADEPKGNGEEDRGRLQGSWEMTSITMDGLAVPEAYARTGRLVIAGDRYSLTMNDQTVVSTFTLDPTRSPKAVDFTFTEGPQKGQTVRGIYEVDAATFRICRGLRPEVERPGQFAAPGESGLILVSYKRSQSQSQSGGCDSDKESAIRAELGRFEGSWRFDSVVAEGRLVPGDGFQGARLVLKGDRFTMIEPNATYGGTYTVDPTARPKTVDTTFTEGPEKGKSCYGIYELDGDTYIVCMGLTGRPRPTAFVSSPGSGHVLEVLKRVGP